MHLMLIDPIYFMKSRNLSSSCKRLGFEFFGKVQIENILKFSGSGSQPFYNFVIQKFGKFSGSSFQLPNPLSTNCNCRPFYLIILLLSYNISFHINRQVRLQMSKQKSQTFAVHSMRLWIAVKFRFKSDLLAKIFLPNFSCPVDQHGVQHWRCSVRLRHQQSLASHSRRRRGRTLWTGSANNFAGDRLFGERIYRIFGVRTLDRSISSTAGDIRRKCLAMDDFCAIANGDYRVCIDKIR